MPIIGGRVERLEAKRLKDEAVQEMRLDLLIDDVAQDKKTLKITYRATMHYEPSVGEITVAGIMFWEEESEKKTSDLVAEYKRTRRLPNEMAEEVVTAISYTNSAVGTLGAFALGLGAPINTPRAKINPAPAPLPGAANPLSQAKAS